MQGEESHLGAEVPAEFCLFLGTRSCPPWWPAIAGLWALLRSCPCGCLPHFDPLSITLLNYKTLKTLCVEGNKRKILYRECCYDATLHSNLVFMCLSPQGSPGWDSWGQGIGCFSVFWVRGKASGRGGVHYSAQCWAGECAHPVRVVRGEEKKKKIKQTL